ncbi:hypothetical protein COLO4_25628 [Corchorus olitorius]|uniref:WIYLD domain-containing protein n=1 Tax=Corchorus olitorius TaxID=93759 RepID=A0A1R3I0Y3_9ROSI|nr:hypothetical protein COLO4_25628 [Corchorus olitorius]
MEDDVSSSRMAPRRPKVGERRIDAAYAALRPMGFADSVIRDTIRGLLKAYGGSDYWSFIEEYSYKLVIEKILEEQAKPEQKNSKEDGPEENHNVEDEPRQQHCDSPVRSPEIHSTPVSSPVVVCPPRGTRVTPTSSKDESSPQPMGGRQCSSPQSSSAVPLRSPSVKPKPIKRRKPCYGWLDSDEEDEPELCYLPPSNQRFTNLDQ